MRRLFNNNNGVTFNGLLITCWWFVCVCNCLRLVWSMRSAVYNLFKIQRNRYHSWEFAPILFEIQAHLFVMLTNKSGGNSWGLKAHLFLPSHDFNVFKVQIWPCTWPMQGLAEMKGGEQPPPHPTPKIMLQFGWSVNVFKAACRNRFCLAAMF